MPCDRDFGRIEKRRRKKDRVTKPSEWVELIRSTDQRKPFNIVYVEHPLTDDMKDDGTPVVKVKDYKTAYNAMIKSVDGISSFRGIKFQRGQPCCSRATMSAGCTQPVTILKRGKKLTNIAAAELHAAYSDFLPIKSAKLKDVRALLEHVNLPEEVVFYNNLAAIAENSASDNEYE